MIIGVSSGGCRRLVVISTTYESPTNNQRITNLSLTIRPFLESWIRHFLTGRIIPLIVENDIHVIAVEHLSRRAVCTFNRLQSLRIGDDEGMYKHSGTLRTLHISGIDIRTRRRTFRIGDRRLDSDIRMRRIIIGERQIVNLDMRLGIDCLLRLGVGDDKRLDTIASYG